MQISLISLNWCSDRRPELLGCSRAPAPRPGADEVAFLALAEVAPVTHAVTNTVKRVVIILASILVFKPSGASEGPSWERQGSPKPAFIPRCCWLLAALHTP